jgi:ribosomal-protein-alanine N-acetyltransferase
MAELHRLAPRHAGTLLVFERENREFFARTVPDRGDDYFAEFDARHAALLAEQATGRCHFHLLVDDDGAVLGRFNLVDLANGGADLGFRMAQRATGRGLAQRGVRQVIELARDEYGLQRLFASARVENAASRGVLRATGFTETGPVLLPSGAGVRHVRELSGPAGRRPAQSADPASAGRLHPQ